MVRAMTQDEISQYERDGAICLRGLFDQVWVERIRDALERLLHTDRGKRGDLTAPDSPGRFNNATFMWRFDADFRDFVFQSPAAEIARQLMRSRTSRFLVRPPLRQGTANARNHAVAPRPAVLAGARGTGVFDLALARQRDAADERARIHQRFAPLAKPLSTRGVGKRRRNVAQARVARFEGRDDPRHRAHSARSTSS